MNDLTKIRNSLPLIDTAQVLFFFLHYWWLLISTCYRWVDLLSSPFLPSGTNRPRALHL